MMIGNATISFETQGPSNQSSINTHAVHVEKIALLFGKAIGLRAHALSILSWGCFLHDAGKIYLPQSYFEQAILSPDDYEEIKRHPGLGYIALRNIDFNKDALEIVLYHHERYDGTGYPFGLKGEEIPLAARICALADSFEVMFWGRNYQRYKTYPEIIADISANSGTQFDPELADRFIKFLDR
ncbi:MAG: metal dependent phosphohydrolase [Firmicutes bacterium]|nr:metal dependent phosphohydrolase [Bacillota bacterium]